MLMNDFKTTQDYVNYLINSGTNIQKIDNTDYLAIHVAAQYVIQILHYPLSKFLLLKAEDGPFQYLVNRDWNIELATDDIISNKITTDLIKLRGCDRAQLEHKNWEPNS